MIALAVILAMAVLNRFRGGGFGADILPGHPRYYVTPVVGLVAWAVMPAWQAGLAAACFLFWCLWPWGHLMCLGKYTPDRPISGIEKICLEAAGGSFPVALTFRHAFGLIPALAVISPVALVVPPLIALAYEIGWRATPAAPIRTAELITGALWGVILILPWS